MRSVLFLLALSLSTLAFAQKDSCNCVSLSPIPDMPNGLFVNYTKQSDNKPFTGICHNYYMKVAYVLPDYTRTFEYGKFKKGELQFFIQYNATGDTQYFFQRFHTDSIFAEAKYFNYQSGKLEMLEKYYYTKHNKQKVQYTYTEQGLLKSQANFIFPYQTDSLHYYGTPYNYKKESVLGNDGYYSLAVQHGPYVAYSSVNGNIKTAEGRYENNFKQGHWKTWYDNGLPKSEGDYDNRESKYGLWKEWYANGQQKSIIDYRNNAPCGIYTEWFENGQIEKNGKLVNGNKDETWVEYYASGKLKTKEVYIDRILRVYETWYEDGRLRSTDTYNASGLADGMKKMWYPNGQLQSQVMHVNGKWEYPLQEYYENGTLQHQISDVIDSTHARTLEVWYYSDGKKRSEELQLNGFRDGACFYYYPSGVLYQEVEYRQNGLNGYLKTFSEEGVLLSKMHWEKNMWDGKSEFYFTDGKRWREVEYVRGVRDGQLQEWNKQGKLIYSQRYTNGKPRNDEQVPFHFSKAQRDSLEKAYQRDVEILSCSITNSPYTISSKQLLVDPALKQKVQHDIFAIVNFLTPELDSVKLVHTDSSISFIRCTLQYPYTTWHSDRDTSLQDRNCAWPKNIDSLLNVLQLQPVLGACYSAGYLSGTAMRRNFTTSVMFNQIVFDSLLKNIDSSYSCQLNWPNTSNYGSTLSNITASASANYTDYYFSLYPQNVKAGDKYTRWIFRVYTDGSVDLLSNMTLNYYDYYPW